MSTVTLIGRTFSNEPTTDIAVKLDNKQYLRRPNFGSNWNDIQIGIMAAVEPNGTSALPWPGQFAVGMCSGTSGFASETTTNFVGALFGGLNSFDTGTYVDNSGNPYYIIATTNYVHAAKRVVSTITSTNLTGNTDPRLATNTGTVQRRSPFIVRIQKGSPNYTISGFWLSSISTSITLDSLKTAVNLQSPTTIGGLTLATGSAELAVSEAAGVFDTVNIYWGSIPYFLELYCVYLCKFS